MSVMLGFMQLTDDASMCLRARYGTKQSVCARDVANSLTMAVCVSARRIAWVTSRRLWDERCSHRNSRQSHIMPSKAWR